MPSTSVIVATYNRAAAVVNALRALERQTCKDFEVLVVVDGSSDGTAGALKAARFDFGSFRILERDNGGRARARNSGARAAQGEILVFVDDDMRPAPDCVERHVRHHASLPGSILGGNQLEDLELMKTDIQRYKADLSRRWTDAFGRGRSRLSREKVFLTAANFSIPKQLFDSLGGFDERLVDAEDYDLAVRAFQNDIAVFFDPTVLSWHDDFITCRSFVLRWRQYARAQRDLWLFKPNFYPEFSPRQARPRGKIKRLFFSLFAHAFWVDLIDDSNGLRLLPRPIRYRLYDYVTASLSAYFPDKRL